MSLKRQSNILYALFFIAKPGIAEMNDSLVDNPFCIQLPGNPEKNSEYISNAIKSFEFSHKIESWSDLAVRYEVREFDLS